MLKANPPLTIPQQQPASLAAVADLTPDQFQLWRHHPVSKVFLQWVQDWAAAAEAQEMRRWISGFGVLEEARGRILACRDMTEATLDSIRQFYGVEDGN